MRINSATHVRNVVSITMVILVIGGVFVGNYLKLVQNYKIFSSVAVLYKLVPLFHYTPVHITVLYNYSLSKSHCPISLIDSNLELSYCLYIPKSQSLTDLTT